MKQKQIENLTKITMEGELKQEVIRQIANKLDRNKEEIWELAGQLKLKPWKKTSNNQ